MSPFVGPLVALAAIVWLILVFRIVLVAARMFQIKEYESVRFLRWGLTREWLAHRAVWLGLLVGAVALSVAAVLPAARPIGIAIAWLASAAAAHRELFLGVQPIQFLVIHRVTFARQHPA